tara:strand:+ start:111 stop:1019 length:909 start_codon:yes stop_codon:yes gene_type:complete
MTEERIGFWTLPSTKRGISLDIRKYKLDNYVTSCPLWQHGPWPHTPLSFFPDLKEFLLQFPIYIDVLPTEIDGYGNNILPDDKHGPNFDPPRRRFKSTLFDRDDWSQNDTIRNYMDRTFLIKDLTDVFNDVDYIPNIRTSWNNLRMLWMLKHIHENLKPIYDYDNIIDFGAGTGHFIKHAYQVGFKGDVQIVDLDTTIPLQEYVLRGYNVKWVTTKDLLTNLPNTLFNSTWGLSETPFSVRDTLPDIRKCDHFIIYQRRFEEIDNEQDILDRFKNDNSIIKDITNFTPWDGGSCMLMSKSFI